jgi:pectate lyase
MLDRKILAVLVLASCLCVGSGIAVSRAVNIVENVSVSDLCSLRADMAEAKNIHQYWIDHPSLYDTYDISNATWDARWVGIYSRFLNDTSFCGGLI